MIRDGYATDPYVQTVFQQLQVSNPDYAAFSFTNNLLYHEAQLYVPANPMLRQRRLEEAHDIPISGHLGYEKTLSLLRRTWWWPSMAKDVRSFTQSCVKCQYNKPRTQKLPGLLHPLPIPSQRWEQVSLDLIVSLPKTPAGFSAIAVFVDRLSKQAHFAPTTDTVTAPQLAQIYIDIVFKYHGLPRVLISDRDPRFTGNFWKTLFSLLGTKLSMSTAYHPQTDGQTERTNRTLEDLLRAFVNVYHTNWDTLLSLVEFAYNNAPHQSTSYSPFFLNSGPYPNVSDSFFSRPVSSVPSTNDFLSLIQTSLQSAKQHLAVAQNRQKQYADRHRRELEFTLGDQVLLSTAHLPLPLSSQVRKLASRWIGPFSILQVISPVAYKLDLPSHLRIHPVFHVSQLKPFLSNPSTFPHRLADPPPPLVINDHEEYEVEKILAKRVLSRGRIQYKVLWRGYPLHDATWEPISHLQNAADAIADFEATFGPHADIGD
jgi:hypothetical protein